MLVAGRFESKVERTQCAPWGLAGGFEAAPNGVALVRHGGRRENGATGKVSMTELGVEEGYIVETGGGGGFGSPLERDPAQVLSDVLAGYVSRAAAEGAYGVVLREGVGGSLEVDSEATAQRRAAAAI